MQHSLAITSESRTEMKSQQIYLLQNLVISPLKYESISRLVGCVLADRLTTAVQENIPCKRREHILLDRQSSLFMLNQLHCQIIKAYVAHRVGEIHTHTEPRQWLHVPTAENPADVGTRSISAEELKNCELWWKETDLRLA